MKIAVTVLVALGSGIALAPYLFLSFSSSWKATAKEELQMFGSERDAAPASSLKPTPSPPVAAIQKGEQVTVVWDTYGKDYWACYVRNSKGQRGWVLCPELLRL